MRNESPMTIPTFAINLDRRPDRWRLLSENLKQIGLFATRIQAVDKAILTNDPRIDLMGAGHAACLQSHLKALTAFLITDAPAALILEDDAELHPDLPKVISRLDWWPLGHGSISLQCYLDRPWLGRTTGFTGFGHELRPILEKNTGAAGYLIKREAASELVANSTGIGMPIDITLFYPNFSGFARRHHPLLMIPTLVRQRPDEVVGSDLFEPDFDGIFRFKPSRAYRYPHKFRMRYLLAPIGQARRIPVPYGSWQIGDNRTKLRNSSG